jgi:hypothetical protein
MLWGRKELLSQLMSAMVKSSRTPDGKLVLKNYGPVDLAGLVEGYSPEKRFDLKPYSEVAIDVAQGNINIRWLNVWFGLNDNLTMTY